MGIEILQITVHIPLLDLTLDILIVKNRLLLFFKKTLNGMKHRANCRAIKGWDSMKFDLYLQSLRSLLHKSGKLLQLCVPAWSSVNMLSSPWASLAHRFWLLTWFWVLHHDLVLWVRCFSLTCFAGLCLTFGEPCHIIRPCFCFSVGNKEYPLHVFIYLDNPLLLSPSILSSKRCRFEFLLLH